MLVLSRKQGEEIVISYDTRITLVAVSGDRVVLVRRPVPAADVEPDASADGSHIAGSLELLVSRRGRRCWAVPSGGGSFELGDACIALPAARARQLRHALNIGKCPAADRRSVRRCGERSHLRKGT
jgi:hypothetical protein